MQNYQYPIKVQIEDTDFGGVVYHANYLKYYERARTAWLLEHGFDWHDGVFFVVRSAQINYLKPARLHQDLIIQCDYQSKTRTSLVVDQHIFLANDNEQIVNSASIKLVCVNKNIKPIAIPAWIEKELW